MITTVIGIIIVVVCILLYLVMFSINQKVEVPEECRIAMSDNACGHCPQEETCVTKHLVKQYKKDKEDE